MPKKTITEPIEEDIIVTEYSEVMKKSYIDYAMSVIIARALPDVRDGLKPVQRRTLYDMHELGIKYDKPYRKSARIVGDTMGKYHPHGDSSIYDALVVMSQSFKKGLPLVDGHGNFGNIEGDGAAAMRYTEARLQKVTQLGMLADLDKDIVDFVPNFDETEKEPSVLPCRFPNFLVNGSEGIAVGMATNTPPHNLSEVIEAMKAYMRDEDISVKQLMKYCKGPDFPTGGIITNKDELLAIYETGQGKIKIRGKVEVEKGKSGRTNIVVTEIPYTMIGAGISKFLQDVAALADSKKIPDIVDISNQSSKEGIRIVIEVKKDANVDNIINLLYKKTKLEDTFGVNMLAIADGRPETMGIKKILKACTDFQFELATRKYTNLLKKEQDKKEIQEGLIKACNVIDLIIEILRGSKDRAQAKACLVEGKTAGIKFKTRESEVMASQLKFTEAQANAIMDMRLYKLIGLEIDALIKDHEETVANIFKYEDILSRKESMAMVIINDLDEISKEFSRKRRTVIDNLEDVVVEEVKVPEMDVVFLMDRFGYCKIVDVPTYERNKETIEQEFKYICKVKNTGKLCIFTNTGELHTFKASDISISKLRDKGVPVDNVSTYSSKTSTVIAVCSQSELNLYRMVFVTRNAYCKLVDGGEFDVAKRNVAATKLEDGDEVVAVHAVKDAKNIILCSNGGYFLRFQIEEIPVKKKAAVGVRGMKLITNDYISEVYFTRGVDDSTIEHNGKQILLNGIKLLKRDTKGTKLR